MLNHIFVGRHETYIDGDIFCVHHHGPISVEELRTIHAMVQKAVVEHGVLFSLVDARHAWTPSLEVRQWMGDPANATPVTATAVYGFSEPLRIVAEFLVRGLKLLGVQIIAPRGFQTEADARAWFATLRADAAARNISTGA